MSAIISQCQVCHTIFKSKSKLQQHVKKDHSMSNVAYYDFCHHIKSKCIFCNNQPVFYSNKDKQPRKYCFKHAKACGCCFKKQYYLIRGYTEQQAIQLIHQRQCKNNKNANDKYSVEKMIAKGYSQEQAKQIAAKRLKANPKRRQHYNSEEEYKAAMQAHANKQKESYANDVKGYHSCWSMNFYKYEGLTDEEKLKEIRKIGFCKDNPNFENFKSHSCNTCLEYYLNKGMNQLEAQEALSKRQHTFSLSKCIEKYGQQEGRKRFNERQERWKKSLDNPETQKKLQEGRLKGLLTSQSEYSKIAMKLFMVIEKLSKLEQYSVYYKTLDTQQYYVYTNEGIRFLDFYIKELNFAIEFDGTYWHRNKTQADEDYRDNLIKQKINNIQILHIKEADYIKNKYKMIKDLANLIIERKKEYEQNLSK